MTNSQENGPVKLNAQTILVVVAWVVSIGVQYGVMKASEDNLGNRVQTIEKQMQDDTVGRREYEARQKDIIDRLGRIENKLDRNQRQGGKVD